MKESSGVYEELYDWHPKDTSFIDAAGRTESIFHSRLGIAVFPTGSFKISVQRFEFLIAGLLFPARVRVHRGEDARASLEMDSVMPSPLPSFLH